MRLSEHTATGLQQPRRRMRARRAWIMVGVLAGVGAGAACSADDIRSPTAAVADGGDQDRGRAAIVQHGCAACHRIPGVRGPDALVGPPLDGWSNRSFIAGTLTNSAANLAVWLRDPQSVRAGSAMPPLNLTDAEIADIIAYLFSID